MNGLLSYCCSAKIDAKNADGGTVVGRCSCCSQVVCRKDVRTGRIERYDDEPATQNAPAPLAAAG